MKRADLIAALADLKPWLAERGVVRLRIFGSHARDEAGSDSDIDLLAAFNRQPSLLELIDLEARLAAKLGAPVDLATEAGIKPRVRAHIERDAIDA